MSENKPEPKHEKKVVGRTVAIAIGIIAIVLLVGLVGAMADYTSIINGKDSTITTITNQNNQLNTWLSGNKTLLSQTQTWLSGNETLYNNYVNDHSYTNEQYQNLQTQIANENSIISLSNSTTWVNDQTVSQTAEGYSYWQFSAGYAGYVSVSVQSSTTSNTYVRVMYSSHDVSYDNQIGVSTGGTAVFPVLPPSSIIEIRVGNTNPTNGATETVTITYYY